MGLAKERSIEDARVNFEKIDNKYICQNCVNDKFLKKIIRNNLIKNECSYCEKKNPSTCVNKVLSEISEAIKTEWNEAIDSLSYDSSDGGWQGKTYNNNDLVELLHNENSIENEALIEDIKKAFINIVWCKSYHTDEERFLTDWDNFCETVKTKYRYTFLDILDRQSTNKKTSSTRNFLNNLSKIIKIEKNLFQEIRQGTDIFRVRKFNDSNTISEDAKSLGTPLPEYSINHNRMSAPGIPIFYGALYSITAINETPNNGLSVKTILAKFKTLKLLRILDFSKHVNSPSLFDKKRRNLRGSIRFLNAFASDISKPIAKDGKEHIEYIPTQIITEYLRYTFKYKKLSIDGIYYKSSKQDNGNCCALFIENEGCIDNEEEEKELHQLRLISTSNL